MELGYSVYFILLINLFLTRPIYGVYPMYYVPAFNGPNMRNARENIFPYYTNVPFEPVNEPDMATETQQKLLHKVRQNPVQETEQNSPSENKDVGQIKLFEIVDCLSNLFEEKQQQQQQQQEQDDDQAVEERRALPNNNYLSYSRQSVNGYPGQNDSDGKYPPYPISHDGLSKPLPAATSLRDTTSKHALLKPILTSFVKPVTSKLASKLSDIVSLVLAVLTGSSPEGFLVKGFADVIVNGIIKPLFMAKNNLKALIGKMTIPIISILLMNLELFATIWWLWDDCSQEESVNSHSYSKHAYHTYNPNSKILIKD